MTDIRFDDGACVDIYGQCVCASGRRRITAEKQPSPVPILKAEDRPPMSACLHSCDFLRIRRRAAQLIEGQSTGADKAGFDQTTTERPATAGINRNRR